MLTLALSLALPGVLFVASFWRLLGCLRRRNDGVLEYIWATGYAMVSCLSATWLAANLASLMGDGYSAEREAVTLSAGSSFFVALGFLLVLRPLLRIAAALLARATRPVTRLLASRRGRR